MEHFNPKEAKKIKIEKPKITKYKTEMIIARYNEDLSWLELVPKDIKITIYNKGKDDISYPFIQLPNIGRESHTYMYHIVNNYDNLADMTIFCQGDPIFHSPDFINLLKNRKYFEPMQPLGAYYCTDKHPPLYRMIPPTPLLDKTQNLHIKGNRVHIEYMDNNFFTQYPYHFYPDFNFEKTISNAKIIYKTNNLLKYHQELQLLFLFEW